MTLLSKIKLLFAVKKPVGEITDAFASVKNTKKYVSFAVTVLGSLITAVSALNGLIPPIYAIIATTALQAAYNILRGLDKADSAEVKGTLRTTEFWMTGLNEIQKVFLATQTQGINPEWLAMSSTIVGMALAAGQNLAARTPAKETLIGAPEVKNG